MIDAVAGVIFDMDGTLVDSEPNTERCIGELLRDKGVNSSRLDPNQFHGITWERIEALLIKRFPELADVPVAQVLQRRFDQLFVDPNQPPPFVPGAQDFVRSACDLFPTAIVTSSSQTSLDHLIERLGIDQMLDVRLSSKDFVHSKPHPECYRLAAQKLQLVPATCVVFEDSLAGLRAATEAGMLTVAITLGRASTQTRESEVLRHLATLVVDDFLALPQDFLYRIR